MKKSLLALAAMGAFAGAAQAQSSVTVYGILDVGYGMSSVRSANGIAAANTTSGALGALPGTVTNTNYSQFGDSYESTSRLGFRGREDLGGGLSAFFTAEAALLPNGQMGMFGGTAGTANRQTFVGLEKNGLGKFALGTQYTVIHNAAAATDPGQLNNMMGNVIYDKFATCTNVTNGGLSSTSCGQTAAGNGNNTSYTVRNNNMLTINTASFSGFRANAFYSMNGSTTSASTVASGSSGYTGGVTDNTGWGVGADFTIQKLLVTANYQSFTSKAPYTLTNSTGLLAAGAVPTAGDYGGGSVAAGTNSQNNMRDNQQYYAATYDFGILKAYAQYVARKVMPQFGGYFTPTLLNRTAQQIGVRANLTKTIEGWASVGNGKINYQDTNSANIFGYQLGGNYYLSKRTNLYAIYGVQSTSNAQLTTGSTPVNPTSYNSSGAALGVRHTF